jgi:segregation and condensation protein B
MPEEKEEMRTEEFIEEPMKCENLPDGGVNGESSEEKTIQVEEEISEQETPEKEEKGIFETDVDQLVTDAIEKTSPEKKVESALFISAKFVSVGDLVRLTGVSPLLVKESLKNLKEKYENSDSALKLIEKEESWKMDVRTEYKNIVSKMATGKSEFSRAEQETLAIISYKQPIKQSIVVKIRGNKSYEHIKRFIEFGLVRGKKIGHTIELTLSPDFYDYFQLEKSSE